jgi:hypothetical protein
VYLEKGGVSFVFLEENDPAYLSELYAFCLSKEPEILALPLTWETERLSPTSARYGNYNFLLYPDRLVKRLYDLIRYAYSELAEHGVGGENESLWIQCWLNVHRRGQHLEVHRHLGFRAHGFFTVKADGTSTVFEIGEENFELEAKNGRLVLIGRDDVWHRVTPNPSDEPRVSIAFDLLPDEAIERATNRLLFPFN